MPLNTTGVSSLRMEDTATGTVYRRWDGTAAQVDTAAGGSVVITVGQGSGGATPPGTPDTLTLDVYLDNTSTAVRSFTLTPTSGSQQVTFWFTNDGTSTGSPRSGTVRLRIRAVKTTGGPAATYDVTTDNGQFGSAANVYQTGFEGVSINWGYVRGTDTLVEDLSNTSLGGAPASPAAYDESLFVRLTSGAASYTARALTVALSHGSVSGSTNSTTNATRDVTFSNVVDDRFSAAVTSVGVTVTVPNAALSGIPDWVYTSTTDDTLNVDPRLTASHHFQVDNDVFALAAADTSNQMLATQSGFLWTRFVNARSSGVNGLTVTQTLDPANPGTTVSGSTTTATRDGQAGWTDKLDWTASKPGGTWAKTVDVTAPADIDADSYVVGGSASYTMLNTDPRVSVLIRVGPSVAGTEDRHLTSGDEVKIAVCIFNRVTRVKIDPDAAPSVALVRYAIASGWEYLSSGGTWTSWGAGAMDSFTSIVDPVDADCFSYTVSSSAWGNTDLVAVQVSFTVAGTPYGFYVPRELTGAFNPHSAADSLNDLADVDVTGAATGDVLYFDGTQWRDEHMPTAAEVANAVWDETTAEARPTGSYGKLVRDSLPVPAVDPAAIVNATWDELTSESRVAGSYGQLLKDRIDAAISSRLASADSRLDRLDVAVSTRLAANDMHADVT